MHEITSKTEQSEATTCSTLTKLKRLDHARTAHSVGDVDSNDVTSEQARKLLSWIIPTMDKFERLEKRLGVRGFHNADAIRIRVSGVIGELHSLRRVLSDIERKRRRVMPPEVHEMNAYEFRRWEAQHPGGRS